MPWPVSPLVGKTTDRRAGCGRAARPVRRAGRATPFPTPITSFGKMDCRDKPGDECDREDAWSAGCKSPSHGVTPCVAEGNCVAESEVESNRKRTDSPQENKPDSAAWRGEPAHAWRSLEPTERADVTGKATFGPMTWLGVGCPEGKAS